MKSTDELYDLIHSLTKTEKRYFRLMAQMHERKGKSNYLVLFDALEKQEEYDEPALMEQFKGEKFLNNLASTKYQLTKLLLKVLRSYHDGDSVDMQIRAYLDEIEILFHKGQLKICFRLLKKVEALVNNYERFAMRLVVVDWRWRLIRRGQTNAFGVENEEKNMETQRLLSELQEYVEYKALSDKMMRFLRTNPRSKTPEAIQALEELMSHKMLLQENFPTNILSQMTFLDIHGLNCNARGDFQGAFERFGEIVHLLRQHPHLIEDDEGNYITSSFNYLSFALFSENIDVFKEEIKRLKAFEPKHDYSKFRIRSQALLIELPYYMNWADWVPGLEVVKEAEIWLKENETAILNNHYITYVYNITIFFFLQGSYSQSLKWLNKILFSPKTESRQDIQDFARIFQLIIHYELGNHDLLEYLFRSTYRYLRSQEKMHEFERMIIDFIRRTTRAVSKTDLVEEFKTLKQNIEHYRQSVEGLKPIAMQELLFYLESKIEGIPIKDFYEEKVREREEDRKRTKEKAG